MVNSNNRNPKISVIVPVYNVEEFLKQCLDSLINQSYKNIEIVVVNDKSPDNSQQIIDDYKNKDNRIISIIHKVNKGLGGARNTGIENATGDYIGFLDSDDWLKTNTFEKLVEEINSSNSDVIKYGRIEKFIDYETYFSPKLNKKYTNGWNELIDSDKSKVFTPVCSGSIYKTNLLKENKILFPEKLLFEDFSFTFKTQILAKSISYIDGYYYYWRRDREGSITYTMNKKDVDVCTTLKIIDDFLKENNQLNIINSADYNYLMYKWSAGTTIYRYLKSKGNEKLKNEIMHNIISNSYFAHHINKIASSNKISITKKLPAFLIKTNFTLFKIIYKVFFILRNILSNEKTGKLH